MPSARLEHKPNGHLECSEHKSYWCDHIISAIKENADAPSLWEYLDEYRSSKHALLEVPMSYEKELFQRVFLTVLADGIAVVIPADHVHLFVEDEQFIGFLQPSEGRAVVASMLDNWLFAQKLNAIACQETSHSFNAQLHWELSMKQDSTQRRQEYWSVVSTGKCLYCSEHSTDFDDLVPDPGKIRPPWR